MKAVAVVLLGLQAMLCLPAAARSAQPAEVEEVVEVDDDVRGEVTYDRRGLIINGTRTMLFSGEMHYPRSTPELMLEF
ncbi:hypothetical protein GUJ93_ZPchr0010g9500 [Zizania palustris]|uniref:Beta-galactosidase n=1 Tax=Zizania palustris TaxID=103762 RepID=A0A8J6BI54_ZIZPA|nr:hypothetical protein GUJ93_ZPchr0010g9500 [Zizania palustris]